MQDEVSRTKIKFSDNMIQTKINNLEIESVNPLGYLEGLNGVKLLVELNHFDQSKRFTFLEPPEYSVEKLFDYSFVQSAFIKHGFIPLESEISLKNGTEIIKFVGKIKP